MRKATSVPDKVATLYRLKYWGLRNEASSAAVGSNGEQTVSVRLPTITAAGLSLLCIVSTPVFANPGGSSLSETIGILGSTTLSVKLPYVGVLSDVSIASLQKIPILSGVTIPVLKSGFSGVPVVGMITVHQGVQVLQAIGPLQTPLPGLELLNVNLARVVEKAH